jgi:hypothetical protein
LKFLARLNLAIFSLFGSQYSKYLVRLILADLRQLGRFLRGLLFPPPTRLERHNIDEIVLKVAFHTITLTTKFEPANTQVKNNTSTAQRKIT